MLAMTEWWAGAAPETELSEEDRLYLGSFVRMDYLKPVNILL